MNGKPHAFTFYCIIWFPRRQCVGAVPPDLSASMLAMIHRSNPDDVGLLGMGSERDARHLFRGGNATSSAESVEVVAGTHRRKLI